MNAVTAYDRLSNDDYQAAMASLGWEERRRIELSTRRGDHLEDPAHAALAAERARRSILRWYAGLVSAPLAAVLLVGALDGGGGWRLWFGGFWLVVFLIVVAMIAAYQRGRSRHLAEADFDALRAMADTYRTTYRRRD